ncbi:hypothetical protein AmaxDRAFT_0214 [Limnospira maxima CS-328]|uniref:Uncharacterized protein n=1 Tax=Limnospira maxima CS-328 TaxID=513049 RepID=B5VUG9_LIMMA|nr:hypothetical protein AmaxDRAFT_0214 [Limnospira maxima CS-328]
MGVGEGDFPFDPYPFEGEGCDQKPKPNCHGGDMPTGRGVDIDTAISRSIMTRASLRTTWLYTALKVEVTKQGVVTLFP